MYHHLSSIKVRGARSGLGETGGRGKVMVSRQTGFPEDSRASFSFSFRIINFAL